MARVKRGKTSHQRHKKLLNLAKGYRGGRSKLVKEAKQSVLHSGSYALAGRRQRRRSMRKLWILQVNIAAKNAGISYSKLIPALKAKNILLDRKILAEIAVKDPSSFKQIVSSVK